MRPSKCRRGTKTCFDPRDLSPLRLNLSREPLVPASLIPPSVAKPISAGYSFGEGYPLRALAGLGFRSSKQVVYHSVCILSNRLFHSRRRNPLLLRAGGDSSIGEDAEGQNGFRAHKTSLTWLFSKAAA